MDWLTLGSGRNSIATNLKTLEVLQQCFDKKDQKPLDLLQWLLETDTSNQFQLQLNLLNLNEYATPQITAQLEQIVDKIQSLGDDNFKPLLHQLSQLDGTRLKSTIEYTLFDSDNNTKQQNIGDLSLNLAGSADAKITLNGNAVEEPPQDQRAVSISFEGNIEAKLNAELPVNIGAISGYSNFSGNSTFEVQYMRPDNELFLASICTMIESGFNPLKLEQIKDNLTEQDTFDKVTIDLGGKLDYGAQMKLGYKTDLTNVKSVLVDSVKVGYTGSLAGQFKLEITPDSENEAHILVGIKRIKQQSTGSSIDIGVALDASAVADEVATKVDAILKGPAAEIEQAISKINALYTPGQLVERELTSLINNADLGDTATSQLLATTQLFLGTTDKATAQKALTAKLNKQLQHHYLLWGKDTPSRIDAFIHTFALEAGVPESLIAKLKPQINQALTKIDSKFDAELQNIANGNSDKILEKIEAMGGQYQRIIKGPNDKVTKAKAVLVKALTDFQTKVNEFVEQITDKDKYQLEASISSSLTRTDSSDLMLKYRFNLNKNLTPLQNAFELLLRGKAQQIFALDNIDGLELIDGVLTTNSNIEAARNLHLSFFGLDLDYKNVLDVKSKVVQNAAGDITALSEADYKSQFSFNGIKQGAEFANSFNIAIAQYSTLDLNFGISVGDTELSINELDNVLDDLTAANLLTESMAEQISQDHQLMCGHKDSVNSLISFKLVMNNWQSGDLLGVTMSTSETRKQRFIEAFDNLCSDRISADKIADLAKEFRLRGEITFAEWLFSQTNNQRKARESDLVGSTLYKPYEKAVRFANKADKYAELCIIMRQLYLTDNAEITAKDLSDQQYKLNDCLKSWVTSWADLFNLVRPAISSQTNRFARTLITSAGKTKPLAFSAEAVYKKKTFNY